MLIEWDVMRGLILLVLADALGDPDDVAHLLLLQLDKRVEYAEAHLPYKYVATRHS